MAAGKPVITSNRCGVSEIIQNNVNGIIVHHAKPQELANQIERLMNDPRLCIELGQNAQENVRIHLSWEKYAEKLETVFENVKKI